MRKSFIITAVLIAAALGSLLVLAFNQFQLYGQHEKIITQTENLLFQYSNIREQIVQDVVEGRVGELSRVAPAIEVLHNNLVKILDNTLIPAEYKFSFLQQIDLPGLVLLLRKTSADKENVTLLRRINEESRVIGERFMLFERLVLGHAKQKLVDFQSIVIGILALVVFLVSILMVITYRLLIAPVISLSNQSQELISGQRENILQYRGWEEVTKLADRVNLLANDLRMSRGQAERFERVAKAIQKVVHKLLKAPEPDVLYQAVCRNILSNTDYVLAWIGVEDPEDQSIMPIVVDGSSSMSCDECQECFSALLAAQEGEEPAYQAMQKGEPFMMKDVLAEAPKGPFKNTSLADGRVDSISLPIQMNGENNSVLTIYTKASEDVNETEIELLEEMAAVIGGKIQSLDIQSKVDQFRMEKNLLGEHAEVLSFTLDREGTILDADNYLEASKYAESLPQWIGASVTDIVIPDNDSELIVFKDSISDAQHYDFKAKLAEFDEQFAATLTPIHNFPAEEKPLLLLLVAPLKDLLLQPENFKIAYAAAIGQYAGCIAHEITDMSNGIINYAQMMSDEFEDADTEKKKSLDRIIGEGEKVAAIVEPLLIDPDDLEFSRNMENIQQIFDDVLLLVEPQLKKDCVTVNLTIQPTSLSFKKQHVQLILFDLLKRLGEMLNTRDSQKDGDKVINISVEPLFEDGKKMLVVNFQFASSITDGLEKRFQKDSYESVWLSQELARALGGEVTFNLTETGKGQVELFLPS